ncbi:hypothetical protein [Pseudoleptotrichia goodfellowii]|uniref:Uncharacterized protein n=1 Tax=Pseudoleptotrichia goodfellowii F0264 TaxID=596323 RepID=D0GPQ0_9FUSO|nr:hypothetical protein [Pseudoleptotrichia goodfellowii]EEY33935.1 hypothetical protein HMPREF0554_2285 [Pseudoleptotrichia goodfellowii F0264]
MTNIWRLQTNTASSDGQSIAPFLIEKRIAAIGWSLLDKDLERLSKGDSRKFEEIKNKRNLIKNFNDYENFYNKYKKQLYKDINCVRNLANSVKSGDLIWIRDRGIYFLGKVKENSKYNYCYEEEYLNKDAANYINSIDWIKIGDESSIPGSLTTAFIRGRTLQKIHKKGIPEFSKLEYNRLIDEKNIKDKKYNFDNFENDCETFFNYLSPSDCEDLVCMYLFYKKGYICIPSTNKNSTELYECVLLNYKTGKTAYIQVKNGEINLETKNYEHLINDNNEVYILTTKGKVTFSKEQHKNYIKEITSENLYHFVQNKDLKIQNIIPKNIKKWINFLSKKSS